MRECMRYRRCMSGLGQISALGRCMRRCPYLVLELSARSSRRLITFPMVKKRCSKLRSYQLVRLSRFS